MLKFLIVLPYANNPVLVKNALNSIKKANSFYQNWVVSFIDAHKIPEKRALHEILDPKKTIYYPVSDHKIGHYCNLSIMTIEADICIVLPETNELAADYLYHLNLFFNSNPKIKSCWSKLYAYYPDFEKSSETDNLIKFSKGSLPHNQLNISQLAFRTNCLKDDKITFDNTNDLKSFLPKMDKLGNCLESGIIAQYEGRTSDKYSSDIVERAYELYLTGNLTGTIKLLKKGLKNLETDEMRSSLGIVLAVVNPKEGIVEIKKTRFQEEIGKIKKDFKIEMADERLKIDG